MSSIDGGKPPYQGIRTFMRSTYTQDLTDVDIAVIGIPLDLGTTNRPGTRMGPADIRDVSLRRCSGDNPRYGCNPVNYAKIVDYGDLNLVLGDITKSVDLISIQMEQILKSGVHPVILGGDHTITYPILKAFYQQNQQPMAIVHFDAHHDYWSENYGAPIAHGTWLYHAVQEGLVDVENSFMLGIRCPSEPTHVENLRNLGMTVWDYDFVHEKGMAEIARRIDFKLNDTPVYLTFDVDGLDPAYAPGTGTPEPGGFTTQEAMLLLHGLRNLNWKGMDVVEVSPMYDVGQITSLAACSIAWNYISGIAPSIGTK